MFGSQYESSLHFSDVFLFIHLADWTYYDRQDCCT